MAALALTATVPTIAGAKTDELLKVQGMVGVPAGLAGPTGAIGSINGAGLPWVIGPAKAVLSVDGSFELKFNDLLFDPNDRERARRPARHQQPGVDAGRGQLPHHHGRPGRGTDGTVPRHDRRRRG